MIQVCWLAVGSFVHSLAVAGSLIALVVISLKSTCVIFMKFGIDVLHLRQIFDIIFSEVKVKVNRKKAALKISNHNSATMV